MKKFILYFVSLQSFIYADISAQEAAELEIKAMHIRQELGIHTPTAKEKKLERIRHELKLDFDTSSKEALLGQNKSKTVESLVVSKDKTVTESIRSGFLELSDTLGLTKKKKDDGYSLMGTLDSFYESIGLESGENLGLPAVFGFNEKKKKKDSLFDIGILGGIGDTGKSIYKGMKYSGQSAEFSSGMIYKSSKMYNSMFGMFEDSPFNVFEEEEETSVFDVFEGGNKVLDVFD